MILRFLGLGVLCLFAISAHAEYQCVDLFGVQDGQKYYNWRSTTLLRFDLELGHQKGVSPTALEARWIKKIGKPIDGFQSFKNFFHRPAITHETIHLSPNLRFAVSKGSDGVVRVFDAETATKVSLKNQERQHRGEWAETEVIYVSNDYIIVGGESTVRRSQDQNMHIDRFYATEIFLMDMQGQILRTHNLDQILKRSEVNDGHWVTLLADQLMVQNIATGQVVYGAALERSIVQKFENTDHMIFQTMHFSNDGKYFFFGAVSHRGQESKIFVFRNNAQLYSNPELVKVYPLEIPKIYKVDFRADGQLIVFGSSSRSEDGGAITVVLDPLE